MSIHGLRRQGKKIGDAGGWVKITRCWKLELFVVCDVEFSFADHEQ